MNNNYEYNALTQGNGELFDLHQAEIDAAFEVRGFARRMRDMLVGLTKPRASAEFKLARTEMQRLAAPVIALLAPTLIFLSLIVITEVTSRPKEEIMLSIPVIEPIEIDPLPDPEPEPEPNPNPEPFIIDDGGISPDPTPVVVPAPVPLPPTPTPTPPPKLVVKSPVIIKLKREPSLYDQRKVGCFPTGLRPSGFSGDRVTEGAVLKALRWLAKSQKPDGSINVGEPRTALSNTALAILTFLAHGETPASKEFGKTVEKALDFVLASHYVDKDGVSHFRNADGNEYAYLIATYALCEAYGMTHNPNTKQVALRALQRIVDNQSPTGGWDYRINKTSTRDDMSFAGWALQALKAGKMAQLHPKGLDECIKKAVRCLKMRNFRSGGFNYTAGGVPTGLTATGCLAMQLLGFMNEKEVKTSLETMRSWQPGFDLPPKGKKLGEALPGPNPQYYCYYATQCKYQAGMCQGATKANKKAWSDWNIAMKDLYPKTIVTLPERIPGPDGKPRQMGYWTFKDATCKIGGDTMATCLCALQLMVYYRYLPTTQLKATQTLATGDHKEEKKPNAVEVEVDI